MAGGADIAKINVCATGGLISKRPEPTMEQLRCISGAGHDCQSPLNPLKQSLFVPQCKLVLPDPKNAGGAYIAFLRCVRLQVVE